MRFRAPPALLLMWLGGCAFALAGGAWVPEPGHGDVQLGFSQKTAHTSWDASGNLFTNTTRRDAVDKTFYHDFRYGYLSGEVGLLRRLSAHLLVTYLYGLEGPKDDFYKNHGLSDAWVGLKYAIRQGELPMALSATLRTPYFYDQPGPYNRFLFDSRGNVVANSPEWRGLLKRDLTLSYLISRSFREGRGWVNLELGYTWREGAPADQIPVGFEAGYPLPWRGSHVKLNLLYVRSRANDSPADPDDRFRAGATFNFNAASMGRAGIGIGIPLGRRVTVEAGYNQWVWGRSARRYKEPYISTGYRF